MAPETLAGVTVNSIVRCLLTLPSPYQGTRVHIPPRNMASPQPPLCWGRTDSSRRGLNGVRKCNFSCVLERMLLSIQYM